MPFLLIPTKRQWSSWSLPSKLTAVGTVLGLLGLVFVARQQVGSCATARRIHRQDELRLQQTRRDDERRIIMRLYADNARQFGVTLQDLVHLLARRADRAAIIREQDRWVCHYVTSWIRSSYSVRLIFDTIEAPTLDDRNLDRQMEQGYLTELNSTGNDLRALGVDVDSLIQAVNAESLAAPVADGPQPGGYELRGPLLEALLGPPR